MRQLSRSCSTRGLGVPGVCLLPKEPPPGSAQEPQQEQLRMAWMGEEASGRSWVLVLQQFLVVVAPAGLSPVRDTLGTGDHSRCRCHDATSRAPTNPCTHSVATCPSSATGATHQLHQPPAVPLLPPARGQLSVQGGIRRAQLGPPRLVVAPWQLQCSHRWSHSPPAPPRWSLDLRAPR